MKKLTEKGLKKELLPLLEDANIFLTTEEVADNILKLLDNYKVFENSSEQTIHCVINYVDKLIKRKYGADTIFTDFPVPANLLISLNNFRLRLGLSYEQYKEFGFWLVHTPSVSKDLGRPLTIFDLYKPELYNRFKKEYKVEVTEKKKRLHSKRILFINS